LGCAASAGATAHRRTKRGFIHAKDQKSRGKGWFEVIAGKSVPEEGASKCFAYVQTSDTKPKRRLFELMKSQGLQANQ